MGWDGFMRKGLVILVIMAIVALGFIQDRNHHHKALVTWTNAQIAKQYLIGKGYEVISYDGNPQNYILSAEKIIQLPYMMYWGLQAQDPAPLFGKSVGVEKFTVRNHPLDNWKSGDMRSNGKTEVYVYIVEDQVVGGTSFPGVKQGMAGGYWSLEGKTLEEVQPMDFRTWSEKWRLKYENQNLIGMPPFPAITAGGDKLAVVRGTYCWNINCRGTCTDPLSPRDLLKYVNPTVVGYRL